MKRFFAVTMGLCLIVGCSRGSSVHPGNFVRTDPDSMGDGPTPTPIPTPPPPPAMIELPPCTVSADTSTESVDVDVNRVIITPPTFNFRVTTIEVTSLTSVLGLSIQVVDTLPSPSHTEHLVSIKVNGL